MDDNLWLLKAYMTDEEYAEVCELLQLHSGAGAIDSVRAHLERDGYVMSDYERQVLRDLVAVSDSRVDELSEWRNPAVHVGGAASDAEKGETVDVVNSPPHYRAHPSGIEVIQITEHMNFCLGNAVKYVLRCDHKHADGGLEDLRKAVWYIEREIARRERQ